MHSEIIPEAAKGRVCHGTQYPYLNLVKHLRDEIKQQIRIRREKI